MVEDRSPGSEFSSQVSMIFGLTKRSSATAGERELCPLLHRSSFRAEASDWLGFIFRGAGRWLHRVVRLVRTER